MQQFTKGTDEMEIPRSVLKGRSIEPAPGLPQALNSGEALPP